MTHVITPFTDEDGNIAFRCSCGKEMTFQYQVYLHVKAEQAHADHDAKEARRQEEGRGEEAAPVNVGASNRYRAE